MPSALVTVSRVRFVSLFTTVTVAPGTNAALRVLDDADNAAVENLGLAGTDTSTRPAAVDEA